jgi:hypothetical protein
MAGYRTDKGFVSTKMDASVLPSAPAKTLGVQNLQWPVYLRPGSKARYRWVANPY